MLAPVRRMPAPAPLRCVRSPEVQTHLSHFFPPLHEVDVVTVYQQIFVIGREEGRQISTGVGRGPPEAEGPLLWRRLFPPAAVNANETRDNHAGIGFVFIVVFGFDLRILVAGEGWRFSSALTLDEPITGPTAGAGVDVVPELPIVLTGTVHHENLVVKDGQSDALRAGRTASARFIRHFLFIFITINPVGAIVKGIIQIIVRVATMDHE